MNGSCHHGVNDLKASGLETTCSRENEEEKGTMEVLSSNVCDRPAMGNALDHRILGDAIDLATYRVDGVRLSNSVPKYSELIGSKSVSPMGTPYHAPHLYFSNSTLSNGDRRNGSSDWIEIENCKNKACPGVSQGPDGTINGCGLEENFTFGTVNEDPVAVGLMDVHLALKEASNPENLHHITRDLTLESANSPEPFSCLSELNGDFDSHFNCLQYGRWYYEYALNKPALTMPPSPPSVFQRKNSWNAVQHSPRFKQNGFSHKSVNGVISNPAFYLVNPLLIPGMAIGLEDMPKPRGTGTYFPNMNRLPQGYGASAGKGRNLALPRSPCNSGRNPEFLETNTADQSSHDLSQTPVSVDQSGAKIGPSNIHQSFSLRGKGHPNVNGLSMQSEGGFDIGSIGHVPVGAHQLERGRHQQQSYLSSQENSGPVSPNREMHRLKPVLSREHDRVSVELSYHLKDEDNFPPFSV